MGAAIYSAISKETEVPAGSDEFPQSPEPGFNSTVNEFVEISSYAAGSMP